MDNSILLLISIVILLLTAGIVIWAVESGRRSKRLREKFGPEYERLVRESGNRRQAEAELHARTKRVENLSIRPLADGERNRYAEEWRAQQSRFVDDPKGAVTEANRLVKEVMKARGYPVADFEQRVADVSVDHPQFVQNYRTAHEIAVRHERGLASTEDLRNAMLCYRALFDDLLEDRMAPVPAHA